MPRNRINPVLADLERECDIWNLKHPIGTRVTVTKDDGRKVQTKTRSEAYVLSGHSAVIFLEGFRGCYLLSRVSEEEPDFDV